MILFLIVDIQTNVYYNKFGDTMLKKVKGLGPKGLKLLEKLGIEDEISLLEYYPFRYQVIKKTDLKNLTSDKVTIDGIVEKAPSVFYFNKKLNKLTFQLNTKEHLFNVTIFNRAYLKNYLKIGTKITVIGKLDQRKNITASEVRFGLLLKEEIEPIYHVTSGLSNQKLSSIISSYLKTDFNVIDLIPEKFTKKYQMISKKEAVKEVHHPTDESKLKKALFRLKYEELFLFMLKMKELKENKTLKVGLQRDISLDVLKEVKLDFTLTEDQEEAIKQIYIDLTSKKRMNRLLQGDVGSGKTIVAILAMYLNYKSGYQSAFMAPTEILAHQHYESVLKLLSSLGVKVSLLTGKTTSKEKVVIKKQLIQGDIDIIIGTHALFTEDVTYKNLGLVITDEQHRFGVNQRANLKNKGITPDILYMSATPIPRTYALTLYGDMSVSSIKSAPAFKKDIITTLKKESEMKDVLESMLTELKCHHQIYVVAPLIEESDKSDLENVVTLEEKMKKAFGKYYKIGILHGKMKSNEKEEVMKEFKDKKIDILIATTVIEVGINVPNATMMVIFDSSRFGLSALHQLRGRVGRGEMQSYCILISNYESDRLSILTKTTDGFKISEEDFKLRGSGDIFGVKQSGIQIFKLADIKMDFDILKIAKEDSEIYFDSKEYKENFILHNMLQKSDKLD